MMKIKVVHLIGQIIPLQVNNFKNVHLVQYSVKNFTRFFYKVALSCRIFYFRSDYLMK